MSNWQRPSYIRARGNIMEIMMLKNKNMNKRNTGNRVQLRPETRSPCMMKMAASRHAATLAWYLPPDITHFIARRHNFKMQNESAFMEYTKKGEKQKKRINVRMAVRSDLWGRSCRPGIDGDTTCQKHFNFTPSQFRSAFAHRYRTTEPVLYSPMQWQP